MFKDKKWWYIIALVIIIFLLAFFTRDQPGLSPKEKQNKDRVVEDVVEEPINEFALQFDKYEKGDTSKTNELTNFIEKSQRGKK